MYIEGRLQLDTWDDKQTGQKRSKLRVTGEALQLLGSRGEVGGGGGGASSSYDDYDQRPATKPQSAAGGGEAATQVGNSGNQQRPRPKPAPAPVQDDDDDIPF